VRNEQAGTQVRAIALREAVELKKWLSANKAIDAPEQQAHLAYAAWQIEQFEKDPKKLELQAPAEPPDGPPIGDDEDFAALSN
jgi:hypothetical protein